MIKFALFLGFIINFSTVVLSKCPNSCSGHGQCGVGNICTCYEGWTGGAADCSLRSCANGTAWVDKAYATDLAHQLAECSNAGFCDRSTGQCRCFSGFTGSACQRSLCPNACSGHGTCSTIGDLSRLFGPDYDNRVSSSGDGLGPVYTNWDRDSVHLCECEQGYFGADCSLIMCPKGDDPLTVNQNYRRLTMRLTASRRIASQITLSFQGTKIDFRVRSSISNAECSAQFSNKGKFGLVGCAFSAPHNLRNQLFDLTFLNWPVYPKDNNLFINDGNPPITDFTCQVPARSDTQCTFTDIVNTNVIEYTYCSNRGTCNFNTGICECNDGFGGPACSNATQIFTTAAATEPGLAVKVSPLDFTASVLRLVTTKTKSDDFMFLEAVAGGERVFYVRGDGAVGMGKLLDVYGGQTIAAGGLNVQLGGVTVANGGVTAVHDSDVLPVAQVSSTYTGALTPSYSAVMVSTAASSSHFLLQGVNRGQVRFSVRSDGQVSIASGGLFASGGVSVFSGGLRVTGGATVQTGGFNVASGGVVVSDGVTVNSNGILVASGGIRGYGGLSVYSGGIRVTGGVSVNSGGLRVTGGMSVFNDGLSLSGGLSVLSGGLYITQGLSVYTGGVNVVAGGLSVVAGGLLVTGGLTVNQGGVVITQGLSVSSGGLQVTGGLTVLDTGLEVLGGLSVSGGVTANGALSVNNDGVRITGGLTVYSTGLVVTGGITVDGLITANSGMQVTGGLTVLSGGVSVTGGVTTGQLDITGALVVSNGLDVSGTGLFVTGGLTVYGGTQLESSPVVFSDRRLKTNLQPIPDALNKVSKLNGVYFNWIDEQVPGVPMDRDRHVGVIAQEVQRVVPEVVRKQHDTYFSVDYASLVPVLIEAIHDLQGLLQDVQSRQDKQDECLNLIQDFSKVSDCSVDYQALTAEVADLASDLEKLSQEGAEMLRRIEAVEASSA